MAIKLISTATFILNQPMFVYSVAIFVPTSRLYAHREEGWELSMEQMLDIVKKYDGKPVTEVHIVGGVHPKMNLDFFAELLQKIKAHRPGLAYQRIYSSRTGLYVSQSKNEC